MTQRLFSHQDARGPGSGVRARGPGPGARARGPGPGARARGPGPGRGPGPRGQDNKKLNISFISPVPLWFFIRGRGDVLHSKTVDLNMQAPVMQS